MDKKSLLQKLQKIKESTKSIIEGGTKNEQVTTDVATNKEESN